MKATPRLAQSLLEGGARVLQLRMKGSAAGAIVTVAEAILPLCRRQGSALVINDRLDVALAVGADGVHLGQQDLPLKRAKTIARGLWIGISTHDEAQARAAAQGGADYIAFGPVFTTVSKINPDPVVGLERLADVCRQVAIPVVAIGGITIERAVAVAQAGAHAAAVIDAVNRSCDVVAAARAIGALFVTSTPEGRESCC